MLANHLRNRAATPWPAYGFLLAVASAMLWIGWRRWTHVIVDFGRELYTPWRLSLGEALYRDVAYFNGPISPYFNSLVFRFLGTSYMTLVWVNILLLGIAVWLLFRLLDQLGDRLSATIGCALFLIVFALADLTRAGNYNFVTPYSHEMTHGSLLALVILTLLVAYLQRPATWRLGVVGVVLGIVFLTKAEFFLATAAATGTVVFLESWRESGRASGLLSRASVVIGGIILTLLAAWGSLLVALSPGEALRGVLGPWPYLLNEQLGDLLFYRQGMGLDAPSEHLRRMFTWLVIYAVLLVPPLVVAMRTSADARARRWVAGAGALWTTILFVLVAPRFDLTDLPRPLPVILLVTLGVALVIQARGQRRDSSDWHVIAWLAFNVYALVLLAKMVLHPRFHNYGFALAMPAMIFLVLLLLSDLPSWIDRRGGYGAGFRLSALAWLILIAVLYAWPSVLVYGEKNLRFGRGDDMFRTEDRFVVMQRLLQRLEEVTQPDETLLVLPEGVMLNYQLRRVNPTPYINFMPPELIMFGEDTIVEALETSPPDVIVLIKRSTKEYGFETLGNGYGTELMRWVTARYPIVESLEAPATRGQNFGRALILRGPVETTSAPPEGGAQVE